MRIDYWWRSGKVGLNENLNNKNLELECWEVKSINSIETWESYQITV